MPGFEAYPKLAGQNAKYLLAQMNDIFEGRRKNGLSAAMFGIKLMIDNTAKEGDLEAISEYLAQIKYTVSEKSFRTFFEKNTLRLSEKAKKRRTYAFQFQAT